MIGFILLALALWLACEICARDIAGPPPPDPYRLHKWKSGERDEKGPE